jgi:hypothetical protein
MESQFAKNQVEMVIASLSTFYEQLYNTIK